LVDPLVDQCSQKQ